MLDSRKRPRRISTRLPSRRFAARLAAASLFVALFTFGGALTAFAGDEVAGLVQPDGTQAGPTPDGGVDESTTPAASTTAPTTTETTITTDTTATEATETTSAVTSSTTGEPPAEPSSAEPDPGPPPADDPTAGVAEAVTAGATPTLKPSESPLSARVVTIRGRPTARPAPKTVPVGRRLHSSEQPTTAAARPAPSVVWLPGALPDPTPRSQRLLRGFGHMLVVTAAASRADWALEYGFLRAEGRDGRVPAGATGVDSLSTLLAGLRNAGDDDRQAVLDLTGDPALADRAVALAHYARAVGIETLITGLDASKERLTRRLLTDPRVFVYPGGRADLEAGRVDVRVVATIAYLADTFGSIDVSCLVDGHRLYARPGVISAHVYGRAVDVGALGGVPILGHQEPGGVTEQAVRALLMLPGAMQPAQVISLLGLGGPSFPLPDHYNHIHVGF